MTTTDPQLQSDGYHTFKELYEHRHALFLALMKSNPAASWYSLRHHDGNYPFDDKTWFIAGMNLGTATNPVQITYHLPISYWEYARATGAKLLENGEEWDGHTPDDVVERLTNWVSPLCPLPEIKVELPDYYFANTKDWESVAQFATGSHRGETLLKHLNENSIERCILELVTRVRNLEQPPKPLISLENHNSIKFRVLNPNHQPIPNGIACPQCGHELMDSHPDQALLTSPISYRVHCPSCGYKGSRF